MAIHWNIFQKIILCFYLEQQYMFLSINFTYLLLTFFCVYPESQTKLIFCQNFYFWFGAEQQNDGCHPSEWGETLLLEFLACLYARVLKSPFWAIPHPSCAIFGHTRHTHTLYCTRTDPCQAVLKALVTSCSLTTTKTFLGTGVHTLKICASRMWSWVVLKLRGLSLTAWVTRFAFACNERVIMCDCCDILVLGWANKQKVANCKKSSRGS